jgi:hypothetical protein
MSADVTDRVKQREDALEVPEAEDVLLADGVLAHRAALCRHEAPGASSKKIDRRERCAEGITGLMR